MKKPTTPHEIQTEAFKQFTASFQMNETEAAQVIIEWAGGKKVKADALFMAVRVIAIKLRRELLDTELNKNLLSPELDEELLDENHVTIPAWTIVLGLVAVFILLRVFVFKG